MKYCDNEWCDGEHVFDPPLQDGGLGSVYPCPICSAKAREQYRERYRYDQLDMEVIEWKQ